MNTYKLIRISKPMKECATITIDGTYGTAEALYNHLTDEYKNKPITTELLHNGGLFALCRQDREGNYVACELILEILNNRIIGYQTTTQETEYKCMKFYGIDGRSTFKGIKV